MPNKINTEKRFSAHHALGRVKTSNIGAANANTTTINNFDALGRITQTTNPLGQFNLGYLSNTGRLSTLSMPNGVTSTMSYADYNGSAFNTALQPLLTEIKNVKGSTNLSKFDYLYDNDNRITQWTQTLDASPLNNWNYTYDPIGQLTAAVKTSSTNAVLAQYAYSYDFAGNRTSEEINNGSQNTVTQTAYASTNEAGAQSAGGTLLWKGSANQQIYSATLNSTPATIDSTKTNFIANVPVTSGNNTVTVKVEDQYADVSTVNHNVTVSGNTATAPVYDHNGNTTTDSSNNTYTYDCLNNLISITYHATGVTTTFSYYGSSRVRIAESTGSIKQFIVAGGTMAEEWDGATPVITKRFYGQGVIIYSGGVGTNYFYTRDHLGSTRELTNSSGAVVTRLDYDPYGVTSVVSGTVIPDFQYASYYSHAPSGFYLTKYRLYSPSLGRWLTKDPIQEQGGINLYDYCGNDPVNLRDPRGLYGIGVQVTGGAEGGRPVGTTPVGAGATGQAGAGLFVNNQNFNVTDGGYVSGGAFAGTPSHNLQAPGGTSQSPWALGATGGLGVGLFVTNANVVCDLKGPFHQYNLNLPFGGISIDFDPTSGDPSNPWTWTWSASITVGKSYGASVSGYSTTTATSNPGQIGPDRGGDGGPIAF